LSFENFDTNFELFGMLVVRYHWFPQVNPRKSRNHLSMLPDQGECLAMQRTVGRMEAEFNLDVANRVKSTQNHLKPSAPNDRQ
jgi:hypothetical protein